MTEYNYRWKPGSRIVAAVKADVAAATFSAIEQRDGQVSPPAVLDAARPADAPLHPAFEWNDAQAAEHYRLQQAGYLIRSLVVVRRAEDAAPPAPPVRAFVRVMESASADDDDGAGWQYSSVVKVMTNADDRARLLAQARAELRTWQRRYCHLVEFARIFEAIEEATAE